MDSRREFYINFMNGKGRERQGDGYEMEAIFLFKQAVEHFTNIQNKEANDYRTVAECFHRKANNYFCIREFDLARNNYLEAWFWIDQIPRHFTIRLEDSDYRNIMKILTDLSDAYLHLNMKEKSEETFREFINVFHLIKYRTKEEQIAFDVKDDYKSLRKYYEKFTSSPTYMDSSEFKENQQTLYVTRDMNFISQGVINLALSGQPSVSGLFGTNSRQEDQPQEKVTEDMSMQLC